MAELENIIESFMSSPENMSKIMDVVKMFGSGGVEQSEKKVEENPSQEMLSIPNEVIPGGVDPQMLSMIMGLLKDYNDGDDRRIKLLNSLRPYLKGDDEVHVDKAIHIVKLAHVAKNVFRNFLK